MSEDSRPWGGTTVGDSGPYTDEDWMAVWENLVPADLNGSFVVRDALNQLLATVQGAGSTSPARIDTGRAMVKGIFYRSTAVVDVVIPTPAANPRRDRLVLRADFAAQTVRVTRIAGVENAVPVTPALTQVAGVTWDMPLATYEITVGAVLTLEVDDREFLNEIGGTPERLWFEENFIRGWGTPLNAEIIGPWFFGGPGTSSLLRSSPNGRVALVNGASTDAAIDLSTDPVLDLANLPKWLFLGAVTCAVDHSVRFGFADDPGTQPAPEPSDGVYFRVIGAANIFAVTRSAGVETPTDTLIAQSATFRRFEIIANSVGEIEFRIDRKIVAVHTANIVASAFSLRIFFSHISNIASAAAIATPVMEFVKMIGVRQ